MDSPAGDEKRGIPAGCNARVSFSFAYFFYSAHPCASPLRGLLENPLPADFCTRKRNRLAASAQMFKQSFDMDELRNLTDG